MEQAQRAGRGPSAPLRPLVNWRRVAEMLRLRHAVQLMDDREAADKDIAEATLELGELELKTHEQAVAVAEMKEQSRLGSYSRVKLRK